MSNFFYSVLAFIGGLGLGGIYFGSLFLQVKKLLNFKSSFMIIMGFFCRFIFMGFCLFLLIKIANLTQILFFFIGFIAVLIYMILKVKKKKKGYEN